MKATTKLQQLGQSLWLDNITREMLDSGQLQRYVEEFSITGLTSNPAIFGKAIKSGRLRRRDPPQGSRRGRSRDALLRAGDRGPSASGGLVRADPSTDGRRRRLGVAGDLAAARV